MLKDESDRNITYFAVRWRLSNLLPLLQTSCKLTGNIRDNALRINLKIVNLYKRK